MGLTPIPSCRENALHRSCRKNRQGWELRCFRPFRLEVSRCPLPILETFAFSHIGAKNYPIAEPSDGNRHQRKAHGPVAPSGGGRLRCRTMSGGPITVATTVNLGGTGAPQNKTGAGAGAGMTPGQVAKFQDVINAQDQRHNCPREKAGRHSESEFPLIKRKSCTARL
jgi:hypothetical protein